MRWNKKGLIFKAENQADWMVSHAQCPTAIVFEKFIRIFFSTRNEFGLSLPIFIDVDKNDPQKIFNLNTKPVLDFGRKGTFDENGIIPSYFIKKDNEYYFYYAGWSQCKNVPYKNFTGVAISKDNANTFQKFSEAPSFSLNRFDPLSATGPGIVYRNGKYYAIYSTGIDWIEVNGKLEHTYLFTYATSQNAIDWNTTGEIIIQPENEFIAHCKPAIIEKDGVYHLWFSKRGSHNFRNAGETAYKFGYAYSTDFINWIRDDSKVGISVSDNGWDSEMICYPHIVEVDGRYLMFYNGNGFGKSGFGYAELDF
ncbi:MAG: hypothetical protein JSS93_08105 [Bacteroidetes bacterium]|nr:hypothetical protein [Bacteroidota bacterium]MBS1776233.1 hypothetical protein [Bacteroidota bacterium]